MKIFKNHFKHFRFTSYEMSGGTRYNSRSDHDPGNKNGKSHKKQGI